MRYIKVFPFCFFTSFWLLACLPLSALSQSIKRFDALCSMYTEYSDCNVNLRSDSVSANFPTGFYSFIPENTLEVKLYDARRKEPYYALGFASTIILGPLGLLGFLVTKKVGDVDYGFTFEEGSRVKTGFVRFKNNRVSAEFAEKLKPFLATLSHRKTNADNPGSLK